jgi:hypothetical protein
MGVFMFGAYQKSDALVLLSVYTRNLSGCDPESVRV